MRRIVRIAALAACCLLSGCPSDVVPADDSGGPLDATGALDAPADVGTACAMSDQDHDGFPSLPCGGADCDDGDPSRFPGSPEVCDDDDVDEDCDPATFGARDADGDGVVSDECCNGPGAARCGQDCDDARPGVNPTTTEACNLLDDDCDGAIDETVVITCYDDGDRDRYAPAGAPMRLSCECPVGTTTMPPAGDDIDCNDALPDVSPGSPEICSNSRDDDCDATIDEAGNDWYPDCDGDGFGTGTPVRQCTSPGRPSGCTMPLAGHVLDDGDCDDLSAAAFPSATERCDAADNDCDGTPDGAPAVAWCNEPAQRAPLHALSASCTSGACAATTCDAAHLDCTAALGCETTSDASNCGACGRVCHGWGSLPAVCAAGVCTNDVVDMDLGSNYSRNHHSCVVLAGGSVYCWGQNGQSQLGDGTTVTRTAPVRAVVVSDAIDVAVGYWQTCALRASGTIVCWGGGAYGELGHGASPGASATAVVVSGIADAVQVEAGHYFSCARRASGAVACWGQNGQGQLGDGTTTSSSAPVAVVGLSDATQLSLNGSNDPSAACALRSTGEAVCWGDNTWGVLGDGTMTSRATPVMVIGLAEATQISLGVCGGCARRASGAVACWAGGVAGGPRVIAGFADATEVAVTDDFNSTDLCALRMGGAVMCYGGGGYGQRGDGTTTSGGGWVSVIGVTDAVGVWAGAYRYCALRRSGVLSCWGRGGLGDGTMLDRSTPVSVAP